MKVTNQFVYTPAPGHLGPDGAWQSCGSNVFALTNTPLEFQVAMNPPDAPAWPAGAPLWEGVFSGQGMTNQTVQWPNPDVYEFTVACGNILTGRVVVVMDDLDVDSDNTDGLIGNWTRTAQEDAMEDDVNYPGKLVILNDGDVDADGVPNFADGINMFLNEGENAGGQFTPLVLEVPESVDPTQARVRFTYSCSDPALVQRSGAGTWDDPFVYTPGPGHLRIWTDNTNANSCACGLPSCRWSGRYGWC